jgi:hypothetical protein
MATSDAALFAVLSVAVFLASAALDYVEAYYVRAVGDADPHRAARMSVLMYVISLVGFFSILSYSWWLLVPECAGLYFGSILAVRRQKRERVAAG